MARDKSSLDSLPGAGASGVPGAARAARMSRDIRRSEVNLVAARSEINTEFNQYSRTARTGGYAKQRAAKSRQKKILLGVTIVLFAILVAGVAAFGAFWLYLDNSLKTDSFGNALDMTAIQGATVDRSKPEDPFWMLLVGTDDDEDTGVSRSDTIILARIDPGRKKAALVSIPRDTKVSLPGYGYQKINAAFAYGQMEIDQGHSGPEYCINAVSDLTGVGIAGYAQVNFWGFKDVVNALGGVEVDVPLDIIGDTDAGGWDIYAGLQVLDGDHALTFVRSRQYVIGDYQRQANQRTFLQAMAKKVLTSDPVTILNSVTKVCEMTTTNMSVGDIVSIAQSMRGMQESDIYTYTIPSTISDEAGVSYVICDTAKTRELFAAIESGEFPDLSEDQFQGEATDRYKPASGSSDGSLGNADGATGTGAATTTGVNAVTDNLATSGSARTSNVNTADYTVAVRNGYGIDGSATAVSDMLAIAGYKQGEIGNANSFVYKDTLIIYRDESDSAAAEDIRLRLGYGRVIPSYERYMFEGNILVVVGGDYKP
ncbi:MAG: LCP family protein [Coriobacteriales bacterium]|jgi:LCP family protein required for cell wall assembly|nr:LCP family protein [Coriobacteriales bacterium]